MRPRVYRYAIIFAVAFTFAHLISLPIGITYDGYQYLDGADVLGTSRFPADWYRNRTPLYSVALKTSFALFGRQPLAAIFVSTALGLGTTLLLGRATRLIAGEVCATITLVVLSLFPTAIAYQHLILTETGTSFFIALLITGALVRPQNERSAWVQAIILAAILAAGYYWRQLLLNLSPVAAALWMVRNWTVMRQPGKSVYAHLGRMTAGMALIVIVPMVLSHLWDRYADRAGLAEVSLRQGIIRQALLAPSDPLIGANREAYIHDVRESLENGNFFSGVSNEYFDSLLDRTFRNRPMGVGDTRRIFVKAVLDHPSRYLSGAARTLILFVGAKAKVNENWIFRDQILSSDSLGSKIGDGPPELGLRMKQDFHQLTTSSAILQILWHLAPPYDVILIFANVLLILTVPYMIVTRNYIGSALTIFPVSYLGFYTIILASIDRFAMPAYPMSLAMLIIFPVLFRRRFQRSRHLAPA